MVRRRLAHWCRRTSLATRQVVADWFFRNLHLRGVSFGENSLILSPQGVGDVVRWSSSKDPVAQGDVGMDTATGRPKFHDGTQVRSIAHTDEVGGAPSFLHAWTALDFFNAISEPATSSSRSAHQVVEFGETVKGNAIFEGVIPQHYNDGSLTVDIDWVSKTAIAGDVQWDVAIERIAAGGHDIDADSFGTTKSGVTTTNTTSGILNRTSITLTHAQADSPSAGDSFRLKITRDPMTNANDTMTDPAQLLRATLRQ